MDFSFSWGFDAGNWFIALLALWLVGRLIRALRRKLAKQIDGNRSAAAQANMLYTEPQADISSTAINEATHRFSGCDGDIAWTVEALALDAQDVGLSAAHIGNHQCYTRWSTNALRTPAGTLVAMHIPAQSPATPVASAGWLASLTQKLGAHALHLFVRTAFGASRSHSITLGPQHTQHDGDEQFAQSYRVFSDSAGLLQSIPASARQHLLSAHGQKIALLWDRHGLVVNWPTPQVRPEQVADIAQFGVALVRQIRGER